MTQSTIAKQTWARAWPTFSRRGSSNSRRTSLLQLPFRAFAEAKGLSLNRRKAYQGTPVTKSGGILPRERGCALLMTIPLNLLLIQ